MTPPGSGRYPMFSMASAAIILAAGLGTRMRSSAPKAMALLGGKPLLWHLLQTCGEVFDRIVVVAGPEMPEIAALAAPHEVVVQERRLGTAHAALAAAEHFGRAPSRSSTPTTRSIRPETLRALLARREAGAGLALLAMRPPDPGRLRPGDRLGDKSTHRRMGGGECHRAGGRTLQRRRVCRPPARRSQRWLARVGNDNAKGEYYLTDVVALAAAEGAAVAAVEAPFAELRGINSRAELAEAEAALQARLRAAAMAAGATPDRAGDGVPLRRHVPGARMSRSGRTWCSGRA